MKRFLSSTACALVMATGAFADGHTSAFSDQPFDPAINVNASELIGMRVYASEASISDDMTVAAGGETEWNDIGEINEILLTRDGDVQSVIVGVGGFLGIGEKDVAVDMAEIRFVTEEGDDSGDYFLVIEATSVGVQDAPAYDYDLTSNTLDEADDADLEMADATEEEADDTMTAETVLAEDGTAEEDMTETDMAEGDMTEDGMADEDMTETEMAEGDMTEDGMTEDENNLTAAASAAPMVDREGYEQVTADMLTTEELTGAPVYGVNDEEVGEVGKLLISDSGALDRAVIDVGGFLGLGEHSVAVPMEDLTIMRTAEGDNLRVYIDATEEALESQPEYQG